MRRRSARENEIYGLRNICGIDLCSEFFAVIIIYAKRLFAEDTPVSANGHACYIGMGGRRCGDIDEVYTVPAKDLSQRWKDVYTSKRLRSDAARFFRKIKSAFNGKPWMPAHKLNRPGADYTQTDNGHVVGCVRCHSAIPHALITTGGLNKNPAL